MNSRYVLGADAPAAERMILTAGPLSMIFEPGQGFLRYIKWGEHEILRGIYVAVRDRNWATIKPNISNVVLNDTPGGFDLSFDVVCQEREIDFFWRGRLTGLSNGQVTYTMEGEARSTFMRNRIGFCVLHAPSACAGLPCVIEKADGTVENGHFPRAISPHQPFVDMRAISHEVVTGLTTRVAFTGDVFEMEDQRNWTDASYKTYSTPLRLPYPVEIKKGDRVQQMVAISLIGKVVKKPQGTGTNEVILTVSHDKPVCRLPKIGLGMASHGQRLTGRELRRLQALHLSHLRVDMHLSQTGWRGVLKRASEEARALGIKLEVGLFVSDSAQAELKAFRTFLVETTPQVARWIVFHEQKKSTPAEMVRLARNILADYDPAILVGAGTNAYFTELNREHPPVENSDGVCYSLNPQVHAFDNASLVETLEAQGWTVDSARQFVGRLPIWITPVTLRPRFNPNATGAAPEPLPGELPSHVDARQMSLFGAAWTVGSLKYLSQAGVQSATYYETTGWRGVMEVETGSSVPGKFLSVPGGVFPLYHVLLDFGSMVGGEVVPTLSSDALSVDGMVLRKGRWVRFLLANMTAQSQMVRVVYPGVKGMVRTEVMDETNVETAMKNPEDFRIKKTPEMGIGSVMVNEGAFVLSLKPYAVVYAKAVVEG